MRFPLVVRYGPYLTGLIDGEAMFIDGLPLEAWLDRFLPDRKLARELTPKPETLGYCKECGKALCEYDYRFWCKILYSNADLLLKFQGHCVVCLCRFAEGSK